MTNKLVMAQWNLKYAETHPRLFRNKTSWGEYIRSVIKDLNVKVEISKLKKIKDVRDWQVVFNGVVSILKTADPFPEYEYDDVLPDKKFINKLVNNLVGFMEQLIKNSPKGLTRNWKQFHLSPWFGEIMYPDHNLSFYPIEKKIFKLLEKLPIKEKDENLDINIMKEWNSKYAIEHGMDDDEWVENLLFNATRLDIPFQILRMKNQPLNVWQTVFNGVLSILSKDDSDSIHSGDYSHEVYRVIMSNLVEFVETLVDKAPGKLKIDTKYKTSFGEEWGDSDSDSMNSSDASDASDASDDNWDPKFFRDLMFRVKKVFDALPSA